jgi:hypothetical protein
MSSSSILYEITKLARQARGKKVENQQLLNEWVNVVEYGHLAELYPERRDYFDSLCLHLRQLAHLARNLNEQNASKRIQTTLQKVCKIESDRLLHAA